MRKKNDRASRTEVIAINDRLREAIINRDVNGLCEYKEGVNDQTIATELGVSVTSVSRIRLELFGRLKSVPASVQSDARIEELERIVTNLVRLYDELKDRHNKLILKMSIERVGDFRHLEIKDQLKVVS